MKLFKNRAFALFIALIVMAGSILINTQIMLTEECRRVEDEFFTSISGSKSIYARLDARLDAANGLWTILLDHDAQLAAALNEARSSLISAYDLRDISGMYDANKVLQTAFDDAAAALSAYELTSSEEDALNDYTIDFSGAQKMMEESDYNNNVLSFLRSTYNKFPANILAPLLGIESPELFE